ncbi:MAG: hypothetical protein IPP71_03700 [Bacteroidetes bacterium]|nr:hypothetical protein [Bacteroidota bacterium]
MLLHFTKKLVLFISLLLLQLTASAQLFSSPESVEYDAVNNRWLVGQRSSGKVLICNPANGSLTDFCTGMTNGPYGIEIMGSILYCCDGARIKGFDLTSGALVFNVNLNASFLNGITSDGSTNLFVTDYSAKKIYRVNTVTSTFNIMATTIKSPNGIHYDGALNRCVFVTWGSNAPVQAMSLVDSTITTVLSTTLSNCDGISRDQQGNWYFSAWGNSALNKTDSIFSYPPIVVLTGLSSPADLGINSAGDSIGIPNSGAANNVVFYVVNNSSAIHEVIDHQVSPYPIPTVNRVTITLDFPISNGSIELLDVSGQTISTKKANGSVYFIEKGNLLQEHI